MVKKDGFVNKEGIEHWGNIENFIDRYINKKKVD